MVYLQKQGRGAKARRRSGFSLIELVIVVVIIGIIAAIAIPRMSRGAAAAADNALSQNLAMLRSAVDLYQAEHGGTFPQMGGTPSLDDLLTKYSNAAGTSVATAKNTSTGVIYGPYLRSVPTLPVGPNKGNSGFGSAAGTGVAWIYDDDTGVITPSMGTTTTDSAGRLYADY